MKNLIIIFILLIFTALSLDRNLVWKTEVSLWADVVKKSPLKARPHFNLGLALLNAGRWEEAMIALGMVLELHPGYHKAKYYLAEALFRTGFYEDALGYLLEVEHLYKNVLPSFPEKIEGVAKAFSEPDLYNNIGSCYYNLGKLKEAELYYRKALSLMESHILANQGLINVLLDSGRIKEAIERIKYLSDILPGDHPLKAGLTQLLIELKGEQDVNH